MSIINVPLTDTVDQWRVKTNEISATIGDLDTLTTTIKTNTVAAINELNLSISDIGDLGSLTTAVNIDLVSAINELDTEIGDLSTLNTVVKSDLVASINEIVDVVNSLYLILLDQ